MAASKDLLLEIKNDIEHVKEKTERDPETVQRPQGAIGTPKATAGFI